MGSDSDRLRRLRATAAVLDDAALAALANKGLVRRARKDLEQTKPTLVGEHGEAVRLTVEEWTVDILDRPSEARCSCPASGICRHILVALLHLAADAETGGGATAATAACGAEILEVTDDDLRRWAGTALFKRALSELARGLTLAGRDGVPFVSRCEDWNVECRWLPGGGLPGMLCSCHAPGACVHKIAAVLAWQIEQGRRDLAADEQRILAPAEGAPRTREEVLESVSRTLEEIVGLGLSRLSHAAEQRIRTLATSAHGVDLPRLERLLRSLSEEIGLSLRRDAQAGGDRILGTAAQVAALTAALKRPTPSLVGRHRTRYDKVGDVELMGLGARAWRTRSGFAGLTVYLWDVGAARWATWTDARPVEAAGFDPVARYTAPGPWPGCDSPARAARSRFRLVPAWRSPAGRLSGRESTSFVRLGDSAPGQIDAVTEWDRLAARAWDLFAQGLSDRDERSALVLVRPQRWSDTSFDAVHQELTAEIVDVHGQALPLFLPHTELNKAAIHTLESVARDPAPAVFGRLTLHHRRLALEPLSLVQGTEIVCLGLDTARVAAQGAPAAAATSAENDELDSDEPEADDVGLRSVAEPAIGILLARADAELTRIADGGASAYRDAAPLRALQEHAHALGLSVLASGLKRLVDACGEATDAKARQHAMAGACLRAAYTLRLTATTAAVDEATRGYSPEMLE
jgi:hypothetical protein